MHLFNDNQIFNVSIYKKNIDRARLYASSVYDSAAISALATKLLELGDFEQAIKHFSQAKNFTAFSSIIRSGMDGKNYAQLLAYLQSARDFVSDPLIDTYTAVMFALLGNYILLTVMILYNFTNECSKYLICDFISTFETVLIH